MDSGEGLEVARPTETRRKHAKRSRGTARAEGGVAVELHAPGQHLGIDTAAHKVRTQRTLEAHAVGLAEHGAAETARLTKRDAKAGSGAAHGRLADVERDRARNAAPVAAQLGDVGRCPRAIHLI